MTYKVTEVGDYYPIVWKKKMIFLYPMLYDKREKGKTMHADYYAVIYDNLILDIQNANCGGSGDVMCFRKNGWDIQILKDPIPETGVVIIDIDY